MLKSAPEKSLVCLLTICLCIVNYGYGGKEHYLIVCSYCLILETFMF